MESERVICNETNYPHDSALTKRFVVKIALERCDKIKVAVSQIFDRVKSVALWSTNIRKLAKDHKGYGSAAREEVDTFSLRVRFAFTRNKNITFFSNFTNIFVENCNVIMSDQFKIFFLKSLK
jgi:hypothetical protein